MSKLVKTMVTITVVSLLFLACSQAIAPTALPTEAPVSKKEPALAPKTSWEQQWENALSKAKKEGELTAYTTFSGEGIRKVMASFSEKYGINGNVISARGPEFMQRMEAQRRAGLNVVDVVIAGGTNLVILMKPQGFLDRIDEVLILPEVTDPKAWRTGGLAYFDKDHYGIGMIASMVRQVVRNTNLVKENEITSYKDVLKPRWKGKMVFNDPTISGTGNSFVGFLAEVWGVDETREWLRQLAKQDVAITRDPRQVIEWVAREKYDLGFGPNSETIGEFLKMGAPVQPVRAAEGGMVTSSSGGIGVVNKRPNPFATQVFVNWLLSREGHAVFVKNIGLPGARVDAPTEGIPSIFFPESGEKVLVSTEETWKLQDQMLKIAGEIFGPLLK